MQLYWGYSLQSYQNSTWTNSIWTAAEIELPLLGFIHTIFIFEKTFSYDATINYLTEKKMCAIILYSEAAAKYAKDNILPSHHIIKSLFLFTS